MENLYGPLNEWIIYKAPVLYLFIFYSLLILWTVISVFLFGLKGWKSWIQLFMVVFIFIFTWYFSLGIFYKMKIGNNGMVEFTSFRRTIKISPKEIGFIEGPHFPVGFIRFYLEKEKIFLFCVMRNRQLQQILSHLRGLNPDIKSRNL